MSTATNNFFGVLGEDAGPVHLTEQPKTASSTSSRKSDVNPKSDPSKARKRPQGAPSNDKLLKESKDAGRNNNRKVAVKEGANAHHSRRAERTDRIPRSNKRDTPRRERSGWGDENTEGDDEVAGAAIAKADKQHDAEEDLEDVEVAVEENTLTLEQFQQQQQELQQGLNKRGGAKKPASEPVSASAEVKSQVPEPRKKNTTKGKKAVETLSLGNDVYPTLKQSATGVIDTTRRSQNGPKRTDRPERSDRKPRARGGDKPKGDKPKGKGSDKPKAKGDKPQKKSKGINLSSLPTL